MSRRLAMRPLRELFRYHFEHGLSREAIARALGVAKGSVKNALQRFQAAGLAWPVDPAWSDAELEARLYPPVDRTPAMPTHREGPDIRPDIGALRSTHRIARP